MIKVRKQQIYAWVGVVGVTLLAVSPAIASAATQSVNTTITASIAAVISVSSGGSVNIAVTPTAGGALSSASDTVTVSTNATTGYTLSMSDSDTVTNLVSGGNTIGAHAGTYAVPTVLATNKWGYAVAGGNFSGSYSAETNNGSSTTTWAGVPSSATPQSLKTTATTATNDTTTVWYAVRATSSQPSGSYVDTVTYTAVTN